MKECIEVWRVCKGAAVVAMFDGSYKKKGKGISFRGKTAPEKDRSELKKRLKEKRIQRNKDKIRAKAAVVIQKCYRAYACLKQRRAVMRVEWDAEIEAKRDMLLQRPPALAYMIGALLFFFDETNAGDPDRLLGLTQLVLQSNERTPSYLHLSTNAFAGSLWIGLVWQRQVVALVSVCIKCAMQGTIPLKVAMQLLQAFTSPESWPKELQQDAGTIAADLGIQLSLGGKRSSTSTKTAMRKLRGKDTGSSEGDSWVHVQGATLFEATLHALKNAVEEGRVVNVNEQGSVVKDYLDIACNALVLCDQALVKEARSGNMSSVIGHFVSVLGANATVFQHNGVSEFLANCSQQTWQSCMENCKQVIDTLGSIEAGALVAHLLTLYAHRNETSSSSVGSFWGLMNHALLKVPFDSLPSGRKANERHGERESVAREGGSRRRKSKRKQVRPVLRRRSRLVDLPVSRTNSTVEWEKVRQQMVLLKDQAFVRKESYKVLDMETNSFAVLVAFGSCLEKVRVRWDSRRDSDFNTKNDLFIVRAVAFHNRARPILRDIWSVIMDKLNPQESMSADELGLVSFACAATVHLFQALDDEDLFNKSWPFPLEQLRSLSIFVRDLLYKLVWIDKEYKYRHMETKQSNTANTEVLQNVAIELYSGLYERHIRHTIMPHAQWLFAPIPRKELGLTREAVLEDDDDDHMSTDSEDEKSNNRKSTKVVTPEAASDRAKQVMRYLPQTISFDQRVVIFNHYLLSDRRAFGLDSLQQRMAFSDRIQLEVRRDSLFHDAFTGLGTNLERLKRTIAVTFFNNEGLVEAGIDGGGLFKEFITVFMKQAFSEELGLFKTTEDRQLYPTPNSTTPDKLDKYRFIGAMMGKAVYEGILVAPRLAPFFLNILLKKTNTVHDLQSYDTEIYRNLLLIKTIENPETLDLNFVAPSTGEPLGPNGASRSLTKENRYEYITRLAHYLLNKQFAQEAAAFSAGFNVMIPPSWIQIFSSRELQLVIGGSDSGYDIEDLQKHMTYSGGYHPSQPYVQGLWEVLKEFTPEQKANFLHFITSCPRPPLSGFESLRPRLNIYQVRITNDNERLPSASTCVNMLKLPKYSSVAVMKEKLIFAISQGAGFELS